MRVLLKKRSDFPKCIRHFKELKGICIGECVYTPTVWYRDSLAIDPGYSAHAHSDHGFPYSGWICMNYKCQLKDRGLLLHEMAHLLVGQRHLPGFTHGKEWKKMVVSIGGTFKTCFSPDGKHEYYDYTYRHR
jgi:hypothetical protein